MTDQARGSTDHMRRAEPKRWAAMTGGEQAAYDAGWLTCALHTAEFHDQLRRDAEREAEPVYENLTPGELAAGDELEMYIIASNDGWEWVSAVVTSTQPFAVRWWDGTERSWRPQARLPTMRRRVDGSADAR